MSSIQASLPLAINKILNAINDFRNADIFDYYITPISMNPDYIIYNIYIKYINDIEIYGTLSTYNADTGKYLFFKGEIIPNAVLSNGKLFSGINLPYYVDYLEPENPSSTLVLTDGVNKFYIFNSANWTAGVNYKFIEYLYDVNKKEAIETNNAVDSKTALLNTAYIRCVKKDENNIMRNNMFYLSSLPTVVSDKQVCYKIVPNS